LPSGAGEPNRQVTPRREVANLIRYRRRKGTLALLELIARDGAGWPARAVEFGRLVGIAQSLHHSRPARGRTADLHRGAGAQLVSTTEMGERVEAAVAEKINRRHSYHAV